MRTTSVSMLMLSHLSDIQFEITSNVIQLRFLADQRIKFVKWLVLKYPDTSVEVDAEEEFSLFTKQIVEA